MMCHSKSSSKGFCPFLSKNAQIEISLPHRLETNQAPPDATETHIPLAAHLQIPNHNFVFAKSGVLELQSDAALSSKKPSHSSALNSDRKATSAA